jgi:hypothetical protein
MEFLYFIKDCKMPEIKLAWFFPYSKQSSH